MGLDLGQWYAHLVGRARPWCRMRLWIPGRDRTVSFGLCLILHFLPRPSDEIKDKLSQDH